MWMNQQHTQQSICLFCLLLLFNFIHNICIYFSVTKQILKIYIFLFYHLLKSLWTNQRQLSGHSGIILQLKLFQSIKTLPNKSFVTERDQCPRRSFDTELKECRSYSPKQIRLFQKFLRTNFKYENQQRAITSKVGCLEVWFLCTALFHNEIYLPMKFEVISLNTFSAQLSKLTFDLHFCILYNDVSLGFQKSAVLLDDSKSTGNDVWGNRENPVFDWMNLIRAKK